MFKSKKDKFFSGAFILAVGGFATKIIGAFYRIPLTNVLGAEGIGIYQMIFPLYCLLLTISSTGVPSGISKLISEGYDGKDVLKKSIKMFSIVGFISTILLIVFSKQIATFQGNVLATKSYIFIAPSVLLVSVISCLRGYFQGYVNMTPTAISQVLEQTVKLTFGLTLGYIFRSNKILSASLAVLSVTISELVTVVYLLFLIRKGNKNYKEESVIINSKKILKTVFPIMLSTIIMPLSKTIESFFILNILNKYLTNATSLYGLYSGAVESLVGVPVSVLYSIAVTSIPIVSKSGVSTSQKYKKIKKSIITTLILSIICSICFYFASTFLINFLYKGLSYENKLITINMSKLASLSVLTLPIMQTLVACIIALGNYYVPVISGAISIILKLILSVILLNNPSINIFAVIITDILCYLVACFLNLVYIIYSKNRRLKYE